MKTHHDILALYADVSAQELPVHPRSPINQPMHSPAIRELPFSVTPMRPDGKRSEYKPARIRFLRNWLTEYSVAEYSIVFLASFTAVGLLVFLVMM